MTVIVTTKPCSPSLAEAIKKARDRQQALSAATDALNASLKSAESAIKGLRLGVAASVCYPDGERRLRFGKIKDEWRLIVEFGDEYSPVINGSREERLQAVALLAPLVAAMCRAVDDEVRRVEAACDATTAFTEGLE